MLYDISLQLILFLAMLGLNCRAGSTLVVVNGGYFLIAVHRLLIVVVSLVAEHGLSSCGAWDQLLQGIRGLPDQGWNLCLLHWQAALYRWKPLIAYFIPKVSISYSPVLSPLVTTSLFCVSVSLLSCCCCYIRQFALFFRFHI